MKPRNIKSLCMLNIEVVRSRNVVSGHAFVHISVGIISDWRGIFVPGEGLHAQRSYLVWGGLVIVGLLWVRRRDLQVVVLIVVCHKLHPVLSLQSGEERPRELHLPYVSYQRRRDLQQEIMFTSETTPTQKKKKNACVCDKMKAPASNSSRS